MKNSFYNKIANRFIKDADNVMDSKVRQNYGTLSGVFGIIVNVFLSSLKIIVGLMIGAISVVSDGINNLSDAGSSVITLIGFKLSGKKPDKEHPFGYGRVEYFAGLIVSVIIIVIGVELFIESLKKVTSGEVLSAKLGEMFYITCAILLLSILFKIFMATFNVFIGNKINSVAIKATSKDSITDCISTFVVLLSTVLSIFIKDFPIDGIAGLVVSAFIFYTGFKSAIEIVNILIGSAPDRDLIKDIASYVESYSENVVGIHDLMLHDYGPGRKILVLHVEVPADGDIMELHDLIDNIEKGVEEKFNCLTTIHMDPVVVNSERVNELKKAILGFVKEIDSSFDIHDFRMNEGETHANVIFDLVLSHQTKLKEEEIKNIMKEKIKNYDEKLNAVINLEYPLV